MTHENIVKKDFAQIIKRSLTPNQAVNVNLILSLIDNLNNLNEKDMERIRTMSNKGYNE